MVDNVQPDADRHKVGNTTCPAAAIAEPKRTVAAMISGPIATIALIQCKRARATSPQTMGIKPVMELV